MNSAPSSLSQEQSLAIDYVKGIGIFFVLSGHLANEIFNFYNAYLFHMPLFFLIGGVLYKDTRPIAPFITHVILKQLPYLVITYLIIGLVSLIINTHYGIHTGDAFSSDPYETIKLAIKSNFHNNKIFLTGWFLFAYIFVSIASVTLIKMAQNTITNSAYLKTVLLVSSLILVTISISYISRKYMQTRDFELNFACQVLTGMSFFILGHVIKRQLYKALNFYIFIFLTTLLFIFKNYGKSTQTIMSWSYYPDGLVMSIINALIGIYAVFFVSFLLTKGLKEIKLLRMIGQNSRTIMAYHLLVFVILDIVASKFGVYNLSGTDVYDNHFINKWSIPVYITLGLLIPMAFSLLKEKIKNRIELKMLFPFMKTRQ